MSPENWCWIILFWCWIILNLVPDRAFLLDKFGATSYEIWCYIVLNLVLERPVLVLGNLVLDQKYLMLIRPLPHTKFYDAFASISNVLAPKICCQNNHDNCAPFITFSQQNIYIVFTCTWIHKLDILVQMRCFWCDNVTFWCECVAFWCENVCFSLTSSWNKLEKYTSSYLMKSKYWV